MGNSTFPLYIYELIQAVQKYEEQHPKIDAEEHAKRGMWCFKQWLDAIPEEHQNLADMLDDVKAYLTLRSDG